MAAGNLRWLDIEAYWDMESDQGNVIKGVYKTGSKQGESYDGVIIFSGGGYVSKYTNIRYRQGMAERFIARNEAKILAEARILLKKMGPQVFIVGSLRRVGQQATEIYSNKTVSGIKFYPKGKEPRVMVSFEGSILTYPQNIGIRPVAEVL